MYTYIPQTFIHIRHTLEKSYVFNIFDFLAAIYNNRQWIIIQVYEIVVYVTIYRDQNMVLRSDSHGNVKS